MSGSGVDGIGTVAGGARDTFLLDGGVTDSDMLSAAWQLDQAMEDTSILPPFSLSQQQVPQRKTLVKTPFPSSSKEPTTGGPSDLQTLRPDTSQLLPGIAEGDIPKGVMDPKSDNPISSNGEPISYELENSVALVSVDVASSSLCGAVVGAAGKFCRSLKVQCTKKSHKKGLSFLDTLKDQGLRQCIFIDVPGPPRGQRLAFQEPFLDAERLPSNKINELLQAQKPVWLWTSVFSMLEGEMDEGNDSEPEFKETRKGAAEHEAKLEGTPLRLKTLQQLQHQATQAAFTPARRLQLDQVEVPSLLSEDIHGLKEIPTELDDSSFKALVSSNSQAAVLLYRATTAEVSTLRVRQQEQMRLINKLVDKVNVLSGLVGSPPEGVKSATVWQAIVSQPESTGEMNGDETRIHPNLLTAIRETQAKHGASFQRMYESVDALNKQVKTIKTESLQSSRKEIVALITKQANQIIWTELSKSAPTLDLAEKFFLKGGLTQFEQHIRHTTAAAMQAAGGPSNSNGNSVFNLSGADIEEFKKLISKLEADGQENHIRLTDLEARSENQTVEIEGFKFASLSQVAAFVSANGMAPYILKCTDPIGMMERTTSTTQSFSENMKVQYEGNKSNMESPGDQKVAYSFQLAAPTALVGTPEQARSHPRKLPKMETYTKFKGSGSRDSGAANGIRSLLAERYPAHLAEISKSTMSPDGKLLARCLVAELRRFLDTLFIYMKDQVEDYGADTNLSEERRWDLVQNITRIVFEVLSQPRRACSEITITQATSAERAPELLWAVLQSHRIQKDFLEHNFKNHPKVGPMLTHFLLDVVSYHDDVTPILDDVKKALADAQQAKRKVDAIESQVKNMQSRLPSKKAKATE